MKADKTKTERNGSTVQFSVKVYEFCRRVPKGRVAAYGEIARAIGKPGSARAVGQALKRNPHAPDVPCHRIVKSDGSLGGYGGAGRERTDKKRKMLEREGVRTVKGRIRECCFHSF